jgi:hypothetical protein
MSYNLEDKLWLKKQWPVPWKNIDNAFKKKKLIKANFDLCLFWKTHKFYIYKYKPTKLYGELVLLSSVILQYRLHLGATEQIHIIGIKNV